MRRPQASCSFWRRTARRSKPFARRSLSSTERPHRFGRGAATLAASLRLTAVDRDDSQRQAIAATLLLSSSVEKHLADATGSGTGGNSTGNSTVADAPEVDLEHIVQALRLATAAERLLLYAIFLPMVRASTSVPVTRIQAKSIACALPAPALSRVSATRR